MKARIKVIATTFAILAIMSFAVSGSLLLYFQNFVEHESWAYGDHGISRLKIEFMNLRAKVGQVPPDEVAAIRDSLLSRIDYLVASDVVRSQLDPQILAGLTQAAAVLEAIEFSDQAPVQDFDRLEFLNEEISELYQLATIQLAELIADRRHMAKKIFYGLIVAVTLLLLSIFALLWLVESQRRVLQLRSRQLQQAVYTSTAAERAKSTFLAKMSHELRTPLNAIIGFGEMMAMGMVDPGSEKGRGYARSIVTSGRHLSDLLNDVLDMSRIEAGRMELADERVDLRTLVEGAVASMESIARTYRIVLKLDLSFSGDLHVDPRRIRQILINLISNAAKFSPPQSQVTVSVDRLEDQGLAISITDCGPGMTAAELDIALMPFGRLESRTDLRREGTGLGLPISRELAELHGGRLEFDTARGRGTRVMLMLPAKRVLRLDDEPAPLPSPSWRAAQG